MRKPAQILLKERSMGQIRYGQWRTTDQYPVEEIEKAIAVLRSRSAYGLMDRALFYKGQRITARVWLTKEWAEKFGTDTYGKRPTSAA